MTIKEIEQAYNKQADERKQKIRSIPKKSKRFWSWVWYFTSFPFVWLWYNLRTWQMWLTFIIVVLVVGIEVWLPFLLGIIFNNGWLIGIATTCEMFWLAPFTPFLPLCIFITIMIQNIMHKIRDKHIDKNKKQ